MELLEDALPYLARTVSFLRRRHRLSPEEAEDFQSYVHERLLEDHCRRLRAFTGRSKLSTYLATVVNRLFVDYRRQEWGPRWSPSAFAVRLGPLAVRLEELWHRDGLPCEEAISWLVEHGDAGAAELHEVAAQLPARARVRIESTAELPEAPDTSLDPEAGTLAAERAGRFEELRGGLLEALAALPAEDRAILRLHYLEGMSIADVAKTLHLDQRPVYRRRDRLLARVRGALTEAGWTDIEAKRLLDEWQPEDGEYGGGS